MHAFDHLGNALRPVTSNVICPAEHIEDARQIAATHQNTSEAGIDDTAEQMLPTALSPSGQAPATHFLCSRKVYDNTVALVIDTLTKQNKDWIGKRDYSLNDDPDEIKAKFCHVSGDLAALLSFLELKVI